MKRPKNLELCAIRKQGAKGKSKGGRKTYRLHKDLHCCGWNLLRSGRCTEFIYPGQLSHGPESFSEWPQLYKKKRKRPNHGGDSDSWHWTEREKSISSHGLVRSMISVVAMWDICKYSRRRRALLREMQARLGHKKKTSARVLAIFSGCRNADWMVVRRLVLMACCINSKS